MIKEGATIKSLKTLKDNKKKIKISDIFLYVAIFLTFAFLIFVTIDLFTSLNSRIVGSFTPNFLLTYLMMSISTIIYILLLIFERKNLNFPEWFKCFLIFSVFVFCSIYPYLNLFTIIYTDILYNVVFSIIINIISISIFYNLLKDNNNNLKSKPFTLSLFCFSFTVMFAVIIELIEVLFNIIIRSENIVSINLIIDLLVIICSSIILNIIFFISLKTDKKLINSFLIIKE